MSNYIKYKLDYLLIVLLSFPILFLKLGSFSLRLWDESIYATNSIEMMERGSWIVPYYNGEMDYWNTKPPMINWLQIISMKIFGINEFAIRFPSALAALGTILLIYWFMKRHFDALAGFIAAMILLTSVGFVTFHGARTGDTDTILTFFSLLFLFCVLEMILVSQVKVKYLLIGFLALTFGFLTKSVAALLFLPPLFIYIVLFEGTFFKNVLVSKYFWISSAFFIMVAIGFLLLRNQKQPGYLNLMLTKDAGLVVNDLGKHHQPFNFYLDNLFTHRYVYWLGLYLLSGLMLLKSSISRNHKKILVVITSVILFYFIFISVSYTKLAWYDMQLFPLMAISISFFLYQVFEKFELKNWKLTLTILLVFVLPYKHVFGLSQTNHYNEFEMKNEVKERYLFKYLNDIHKTEPQRMIVFCQGYKRALEFYQTRFKERNIELIISNKKEYLIDDILIIEDEELSQVNLSGFTIKQWDRFENLNVFKLK